MNSTKLHSLLWDAGRRNGSGSFGLQHWRVGKRIKEGGKPGGDLSKAGAADRESNVEHMQTAASSNERGNRRGFRGSATEKKREEELEAGGWAGRRRLEMGRRIQIFGLLERKRQREEAQERKTPATLSLDEGLIQN